MTQFLYVIGQLGTGGSEHQLCNLLERIQQHGIRAGVCVWNYRADDWYVDRLKSLGIEIFALAGETVPGKLAALKRLVWRIQPKLVHSQTFYTNFVTWFSSLGTSAVTVGSVRSDYSYGEQFYGLFSRRLNSYRPRFRIFNSLTAARQAERNGNCRNESICVVRNGVHLERFHMTPLRIGCPVRLVGIGSLTQNKRWDRFLQLAATLKQKNLCFEASIAGDGPLSERLKQTAVDLCVADCVRFLGPVSDVASLLSESTILVHCADSEGCPNVVMEALACGRPVVSTCVGDVPYLVDHGENGFVVPCGDDGQLARAVESLITDSETCQRMSVAARAKAEREFGLDRLADETLSAYRRAGWQE